MGQMSHIGKNMYNYKRQNAESKTLVSCCIGHSGKDMTKDRNADSKTLHSCTTGHAGGENCKKIEMHCLWQKAHLMQHSLHRELPEHIISARLQVGQQHLPGRAGKHFSRSLWAAHFLLTTHAVTEWYSYFQGIINQKQKTNHVWRKLENQWL